MAGKQINPTMSFKNYMQTQIRYMKLVSKVKRIDMLTAIDRYAIQFKMSYAKKHGCEIFWFESIEYCHYIEKG